MAQLTVLSLPIPEDPGSYQVIGNSYWTIILLLTVCRKDKNKEKEAGNGPFKRCSYKGSFYLSLRKCFIPWNLYLESSRSKTRSCWSEQLIWERFIKPLFGGPAFKNTKQFILFFTFKTKFMLLVCSLLGRSISSIASLIKRPKITLLTYDSTARFSISVWFD